MAAAEKPKRRGTSVAKPAGLKLVEGRGHGRDSGGRPVKPTPGFTRLPPEPPEFLFGDARECWDVSVAELQRLQLTKPVDWPALTAYCLAYQRMCQAQRLIQEDGQGLLHTNSQGRTRHPAVAIVEAASKELRAWAQEFGLTPAAETRVGQTGGDDGDGENPFE